MTPFWNQEVFIEGLTNFVVQGMNESVTPRIKMFKFKVGEIFGILGPYKIRR